MRKIIIAIAGFLALSACSTLNCPLNNIVYVNISMAGKVDTLKDTLTVWTLRADGTDSIIFNKGVNTTSLKLPISYAQDADTWVLSAKDTLTKTTINDTIRISKTNEPHFESVDCGPVFFHELTGISFTNHLLENVTINQQKVDYDATQTHIYIYYGTRD